MHCHCGTVEKSWVELSWVAVELIPSLEGRRHCCSRGKYIGEHSTVWFNWGTVLCRSSPPFFPTYFPPQPKPESQRHSPNLFVRIHSQVWLSKISSQRGGQCQELTPVLGSSESRRSRGRSVIITFGQERKKLCWGKNWLGLKYRLHWQEVDSPKYVRGTEREMPL